MQVIATAGHVDHGKSALLRALTGMEPDRWAEEQRRGMTIDLGYVWLALASGERLAFVDVPGHAKFVPNMLAGVGQVPAVLFVVAADGGWMPQSAEHLAAIDALRISHGLLVVTRADLADPGPALAQAKAHLARSSLGQIPAVAVSAVTGLGLTELTGELERLAARLPVPDQDAQVRIWVDRAFSITGAGTVLTGTLPAGTVSRGDELLLTPTLRPVKVRGLQSLGENAGQLTGVSRVALNLRGVDAREVDRGAALIRPGEWTLTAVIDVRVAVEALPRLVTVHAGSARTPAKVRPLGTGSARLTLRDPLPLHVADLLLLRDPGAAPARAVRIGPELAADERAGWPGLTGAVVLDVRPPPVNRRGAAAAAAAQLSSWPDQPTAAQLLRRHKLLRSADLTAMGVAVPVEQVLPGWHADPGHLAELKSALADVVAAHAAAHPLAAGLPVDAARTALGLPDRELVGALLVSPMIVQSGLIMAASSAEPAQNLAAAGSSTLPAALAGPIAQLLAELAARPFSAPEAGRLTELGLDHRALAAAARHGAVLRIADQLVLAPGADLAAVRLLAELPQPFSAAEARAALGSTRRTVIPLLEYLDRQQFTRRLADDRREIR
jgi:selenocysteine-specific elongation factor